MTLSRIVTVFSLVLTTTTACDGEDEFEDDDDDGGAFVQTVSTDECASGQRWGGGDEESTLMRPGGDCIGCHALEGEGPLFLLAGTVYADARAADDCFGVQGAVVEITDAEGTVWSLTTNAAGNFYLEPIDGPVVFPYDAVVKYEGRERPMVTAQPEVSNCASCHTQMGLNAAPGRIIVP